MLLNVQTYLLTHTLADLAKEHGVYARFSTKNPRKFSLNYDQLEARDSDPISQECRGLILTLPQGGDVARVSDSTAVVGPTEVLARPMNRFFNYGQEAAASVDFDNPNTAFYEKLDGTLCLLYWDKELMEWCIGTRSVPDADLSMDGFGNQTFSDLFWKAFSASGGKLSGLDYARGAYTFSFELCTPDNQIVVKYNDYKAYLLAVRNNFSGVEDKPENWTELVGTPIAPCYKLGSVEQMLNFVSNRAPSEFEGIVVCDPNFKRVKVKNAGYLALNKIKDSVAKSPRAALEIILLEKEDDIFPLVSTATAAWIRETKLRLQSLLRDLDEEYSKAYSADRKTFALAIQAGSGHMSVQMTRWQGRCKSAHDWILVNRVNGSWSDGFLANLLKMLSAYDTTSTP